MHIILTILITILIFGVIIFIHEFGHFIVARLCHVTVLEFSLGMGPVILKHQGKRTLYSLRLFPIGGFCSMEGEDAAGSGSVELPGKELPEEAAPPVEEPDPNAFNKKSVPARIAISAAGAFMNILLGFAIILSLVAFQPYYISPVIAQFNEDAPAGISTLQEGDKILKMNKTSIVFYTDISFELSRDSDSIVDMVVLRDGKKVSLPAINFSVKGEDGKLYWSPGFKVTRVSPSFFGAFDYAGRQTFSLMRNSILSISDLVTGRIGLSELSGPVGVGQVVGQAAQAGLMSVLSLAAFISISIGIFNLLPFPALDGGRIVFLLLEAVRRKPVNPKWEGYINAAGLILLFGLMIVVTLKDIIGLF